MGAFLRAGLVLGVIAAPAALLPEMPDDTAQVVIILGLLAAILTFIEYSGRYPSFTEFRFAPPMNRLRFAFLAATVLAVALILRGTSDPTAIPARLQSLGTWVFGIADVAYAPPRLMAQALSKAGDGEVAAAGVEAVCGLAYLLSLGMIATILALVHLRGWPAGQGAFNVWINLPFFDPTAGPDVVERLRRDSAIYVLSGLLLPFFIPAALDFAAPIVQAVTLAAAGDTHALVWTVTIWSILPAGMVVRGIALSRIAGMIAEKRRRAYARADGTDAAAGLHQGA